MLIPENLKKTLLDAECCGILFSGGFDSEVLLRSAASVLGTSRVLPLTADTGLLAAYYKRYISSVTEELGLKPVFVPLDPLSRKDFVLNSDNRCYICKKELFTNLKLRAVSLGYGTVMDGTTIDDLKEYRPGLAAAKEIGIVHPYVIAGMGRKEIAELGDFLGIHEEDHPSDSCLATRIPRGERITYQLLDLVERMEAPVRPYAKGRFRVRIVTGTLQVDYTSIDSAVIENSLDQMKLIADNEGLDLQLNPLDE